MKSTVATLLCMGMVTATPESLWTRMRFGREPAPEPVPTIPEGMKQLDCLAGECTWKVYSGTWKATLAEPKLIPHTKCSSLYYMVNVYNAVPLKKVGLEPDLFRKGEIIEACGRSKLTVQADGEPNSNALGFRAPISDIIRGYLQIEKVWMLEGKIVAAAVQHPLFNPYDKADTPELKSAFTSVKSLWVNTEVKLSEDSKVKLENAQASLLTIAKKFIPK